MVGPSSRLGPPSKLQGSIFAIYRIELNIFIDNCRWNYKPFDSFVRYTQFGTIDSTEDGGTVGQGGR